MYNLHGDEELNKWFTGIDDNRHRTRRSIKPYLKLPSAKTKFERFSILHRCCKLYNLFLENDVLSSGYDDSGLIFTLLMHSIRDSYILSNQELVKKVFEN